LGAGRLGPASLSFRNTGPTARSEMELQLAEGHSDPIWPHRPPEEQLNPARGGGKEHRCGRPAGSKTIWPAATASASTPMALVLDPPPPSLKKFRSDSSGDLRRGRLSSGWPVRWSCSIPMGGQADPGPHRQLALLPAGSVRERPDPPDPGGPAMPRVSLPHARRRARSQAQSPGGPWLVPWCQGTQDRRPGTGALAPRWPGAGVAAGAGAVAGRPWRR